MKSGILKTFALFGLIAFLHSSEAEAQFRRYEWRGNQRKITNDCSFPNLPANISAKLREESLDPIAYVRELSTGYLFSGGFSNRKTFYAAFSYPTNNGCMITLAHQFYNVDRRKKTADVYSSMFAQCERMCTVTYYGKLKYK